MKKVELRLNGKPTVLGGPGPKTQRVITFIHAIQDGEFYDQDGIAERLKTTRDAVKSALQKFPDEVGGRSVIVPGSDGACKKIVFGSKKGIAKLKAQLEIE